MRRTNQLLVASLILIFGFFWVSRASAQIDMGGFTISGSAEVDGLPRTFSGGKSKFEQYRDIPESVIANQLQLFIGSKKEDFYLNLDSYKTGLEDQNYRVRFGKYGLLDFEFEWDQIPQVFNVDNARTVYNMNDGNYTLPVRTTGVTAPVFSDWVNTNARSVNLTLLEKLAKFSLRYTPTPGWTFTGKYWYQNNDGLRPFGIINGSSPTSGNISELAEPINYETNNIELGGEYAGSGWSLGLKYNGSLFHNSTSTLAWDNPLRPVGAGPCVDQTLTSPTNVVGPPAITAGAGPCRGQLDLYPSNQAHTFTLTGAARLPWKTQFLGTASYGWRLQDDSFLPTTNNQCYTNDPALVGTLDFARCRNGTGLAAQALQLLPTLSRNSLNADVRPTMVNLSFVNNLVDHLNLKAFYRFYDLQNRTSTVTDPTGIVLNDQGNPDPSRWGFAPSYEYSKNSAGFQAGYDFTQWLSGKFNFGWEQIHRSQIIRDRTSATVYSDQGEFFNNRELKIGPTFDLKPESWLLFRAAYQHSWRNAPGYNDSPAMIFVNRRDQDKVTLFTDVSPWETLSFHGGFDVTSNTYPSTTFGVKYDNSYSPSVGFLYAPLEWLKIFGDYNFDNYRWRENYSATLVSRGNDKYNTFSLGTDIDLIKNVLGFRLQYGFSQGLSKISNSPAVRDYPNNTNTWQELLARFEYQFHKNISAQLGYYFNNYRSKDYGVDIMRPWMGNVDTATGQIVSTYLGDQFKKPFSANIAVIGLKLKF